MSETVANFTWLISLSPHNALKKVPLFYPHILYGNENLAEGHKPRECEGKNLNSSRWTSDLVLLITIYRSSQY